MDRIAEPGPHKSSLLSLRGLIVAGTYRVMERLGGGGMGEVHAAEHVRLKIPVAIKLLRTSTLADPRAAERFREEARRLAAIRCDNVVRVFDCGELDDRTPFLVMERLFGEDFRALLARERSLPVRRAVKLVLDACHGLTAVHAGGLVHRDLKPANLFVVQASDGKETCKILDFGAAKLLAGDNTTRPGTLVGTVRYMAPEQLENSAAATASADIYALGAILYEALTGVVAHGGETLEEIMFDILHRRVRPASEHRALPPALDAAVSRALAHEPAQRFPSVEAFAAALAPFGPLDRNPPRAVGLDDSTLNESNDAVPVVARVPRQGRSALWTNAAALCVGAVVGWSVRVSSPKITPERRADRARLPPAQASVPPILTPLSGVTVEQTRAPPAPTALLNAAPANAASAPAHSRAPRQRAQPAAPHPHATGIVDRFDAKDPYE